MENNKLKVANALVNEAYDLLHSMCFDQKTSQYVTPGDTEEECDDFNIVMGDIMKTRRELKDFIAFHTKNPLPFVIEEMIKKGVESIMQRI